MKKFFCKLFGHVPERWDRPGLKSLASKLRESGLGVTVGVPLEGTRCKRCHSELPAA